MAVPKKRTSSQKRDQRRAHDFLTTVNIAEEKTSGEKHFPHHMTKDGYYKGKQILIPNPILVKRNEEANAHKMEENENPAPAA